MLCKWLICGSSRRPRSFTEIEHSNLSSIQKCLMLAVSLRKASCLSVMHGPELPLMVSESRLGKLHMKGIARARCFAPQRTERMSALTMDFHKRLQARRLAEWGFPSFSTQREMFCSARSGRESICTQESHELVETTLGSLAAALEHTLSLDKYKFLLRHMHFLTLGWNCVVKNYKSYSDGITNVYDTMNFFLLPEKKGVIARLYLFICSISEILEVGKPAHCKWW